MEIVRKACISDVPKIAELVNSFARKDLMLPKPLSRLYEDIRDFTIVEKDGQLLGCGALHVYWDNLAEIRSLAISEGVQRAGLGSKIVETLMAEAKDFRLYHVFALSYKPEFFKKHGFKVIDKNSLPQKIWKDCINCPHFPNCNEVALDILLDGE